MDSLNDFYEWLNSFINFEKRPHKKAFSLAVIRYYAALFSNPQTAYKTIHIAGSKGKGSVAAMFSALLTEAGYTAGLYTSPHVNDFRERITKNGRFFSDSVYLEAFRTVREKVLSHIGKPEEPQPSWFELVTLTAFILFRQERLDWAVFETGMGGRLDATNIIEPELTLLTPIELEHCEYLGTTIELIAAEKAGIIKENTPVFCARQQEAALAVLKQRAATLNAPFYYVPELVEKSEHRLTEQGRDILIRFSAGHPVGAFFTRPIHTVLPLFTPVQIENAALAAAAFKYRYPDAPEELIERGLAKAWLPARFQILSTAPLIILDGAHTYNSIQACADTFFALLGFGSGAPDVDNKPLLVFACAADKNPDSFAPIFRGKMSRLYLTVPGTFKKGNLAKTVSAFTQVFAADATAAIVSGEDFNEILKQAFEQSHSENRPLLITGSFYLAAEAQRIYSAGDFQDRGMKDRPRKAVSPGRHTNRDREEER